MSDQTTTIADLRAAVQRFVDERDWAQFHNPKNLSMAIAIEAAELMEHFQWLRSDELDAVKQDRQKMAEIREEIADIAAYMLSFASVMVIDVSSALADKMQKNAGKYPVEEYRGRF